MQTAYKRSEIVPVISHSHIKDQKEYVLTIRDLPDESKPREKLLEFGVGALSLEELMAIIINSGTRREGVLAMASRISQEYGEKSIASARDPKIFAKNLDIPLVRAAQIIASVELGRRLFERNPNGARVIRTAADVFDFARNMIDLPKEHLRGIYLNSHYKVIHDEIISIGTIDANIIHPREVFKPALEYAAVAVVLVHNHPSGELTPSNEDREVTDQLVSAGKLLGIELIDHVIVSRNGFVSLFNQ